MTKEEYNREIQRLERIEREFIENNRIEIVKLSNKYIAEHCKFKVGDIVKLDKQKGQIVSLDVNSFGNFCGDWRKYKKNGELYVLSHHFYSFEYSRMEKVEDRKEVSDD